MYDVSTFLDIIVWFQKISIPTPWKIIGNSEGEGGSKAVISKG